MRTLLLWKRVKDFPRDTRDTYIQFWEVIAPHCALSRTEKGYFCGIVAQEPGMKE